MLFNAALEMVVILFWSDEVFTWTRGFDEFLRCPCHVARVAYL